MLRMTIGKKMGTGLGAMLAFIAGVAIVAVLNMANMDRDFSYVIEHDAKVIANARQLLTLVVDMETGERGFIITGKEEFLEPYDDAVASFADLLDEEKALVSDNPAQLRRLEMIEDALWQWQEKAGEPEIAMRRKVGVATSNARQATQ